MTRMFLILGVLAGLAWPLAGRAQDARPEAAPEALELVFIRDSGPVLLRVQVLMRVSNSQAEESVQGRFHKFLKKWFDFLDSNGDGKLNAKELIGAPKATTMAQVLRNGAFFQGQPNSYLNLADLKKGPTETATLDDFVGYYRRNNIQALQIAPSFRGAQFADQPGEALFKLLDVNKDGKLSREEVQAAPALLRKFDLNDDELVAAVELVPTDPTAMMRIQAAQARMPVPMNNSFGLSFYSLVNNGDRERLPQILLSHFDKDDDDKLSRDECGFDTATMTRLDRNKDGALDTEELAEWLKGSADFEFILRLPAAGGALSLDARGVGDRFKNAHTKASMNSALVKLSDVEITVQGRDTGVFARAEVRQFLLQQFRQADTDERGYVEASDLKEPQLQFLRNLFPIVDRNGDAKMTMEELNAYLTLQTEATRCQASLAIIEQGRALFQIFDVNRDGQLSIHELRSAWSRLEPLDAGKKGLIEAKQIARQFQLVIAPGPAQNFVAINAQTLQGRDQVPGSVQLPKSVPEWFRKMDTNADGFLSPREFLGSQADFGRIDSNGDALLDPQEAQRFDAQVRATKN